MLEAVELINNLVELYNNVNAMSDSDSGVFYLAELLLKKYNNQPKTPRNKPRKKKKRKRRNKKN
ncbi:hypothetical protein [Metabacillus sp. SLBN-84]